MKAEKESTTYNGWSNYETWAVSLWLDNEESSYRYWREQVRHQRDRASQLPEVRDGTWTVDEAAVIGLAEQLKDEVAGSSPLQEADLYTDLLTATLSEVNWGEIAEHLLLE